MRRLDFKIVRTLLAVALATAGFVACNKEDGLSYNTGDNSTAIEFSAYASQSTTKAHSYSTSEILGFWDKESSEFTPGTGVGVFAFYQKAKSNGYPVDFNKNIGEPTYMYNQLLERTTTDGEKYNFIYSPAKYWPNNENDRISFFAYAPYDITAAWEDLQLQSTIKGDRVWRHYELEGSCEDQTDFIWTDPVLNMMKPESGEKIHFSFKHICARIGASCQIDVDDNDAFVTVDKVTVRAKFNSSGDYVYRLATGASAWENLEYSEKAKDYVMFKSSDPEKQRVTTKKEIIGEDAFIFPFPGTQDIVLTAVLSQHNSNGKSFSHVVTKTFPAMELEEGKAYNFLLSINLSPIEIGAVDIAEWTLYTGDQTIPKNE